MARWALRFGLAGALAASPLMAAAAETVTYTYDALGRLVRTQRSGGPATGVDAQMSYDPAGNRVVVEVSGASGSTPPPLPGTTRVIVLPINGYTVMPLGN